MRKSRWSWPALTALVLVALPALARQDDAGPKDSKDAPAKKPSSVERIPDPDYRAKRGDHAMVFGYSEDRDATYTPKGATYAWVYNDYSRSLAIKDYDGVKELMEREVLIPIPLKTGVLVLEVEEFPADDPRSDSAVVRVTDGPLKGKKLWLAQYEVNRLIDNPNYVPSKAGVDQKPDPRSKEAGQQLSAAERYRRTKNYPLARKWYERVIRDFADFPEAEMARERLKDLPKK